MSKIYIGFSRPKDGFKPFSSLIRLMLCTPYSHTYIKFYSETYDRNLIYQESGSQINFISEKAFNEIEIITDEFEIEVTSETKQKTVQYAIDNLGIPYGILQIIGIGYYMLQKRLGKNPDSNIFTDGPMKMVCSELVGRILIEIGLTINENPDIITPKDIYEFLEKQSNIKHTVIDG